MFEVKIVWVQTENYLVRHSEPLSKQWTSMRTEIEINGEAFPLRVESTCHVDLHVMCLGWHNLPSLNLASSQKASP